MRTARVVKLLIVDSLVLQELSIWYGSFHLHSHQFGPEKSFFVPVLVTPHLSMS